MTPRLRYPDGTRINIEGVPRGWLWIDVADSLSERGEISEDQLNMVYGHPDGEKEALGTLKFRELKVSDVDEGPFIPPPTNIRSNLEPAVVRYKTYAMHAMCSLRGGGWIAKLISEHEPITKMGPKNTMDGGSNQRIHLILDDSGSMRDRSGPSARTHFEQLKIGVRSFLRIVSNAQIGIRWFNSPSLPICPASRQHDNCINSAIPKGGNDHAKSLFELVQGARSNQTKSGDIVIMFTDGKPDGKGKNVIEAANLVRKRGLRIITIGCGDSEPGFMRKLCSSAADHYQVDDISDLEEVFRRVGKSLVQKHVHRDDESQSNTSTPATQVQSSTTLEPVTSVLQNSFSTLETGQGFDVIYGFKCHFCRDEKRILCSCGTTLCGGGHTANTISCPKCGNSSEFEMSDRVFGGATAGSSKKGD